MKKLDSFLKSENYNLPTHFSKEPFFRVIRVWISELSISVFGVSATPSANVKPVKNRLRISSVLNFLTESQFDKSSFS